MPTDDTHRPSASQVPGGTPAPLEQAAEPVLRQMILMRHAKSDWSLPGQSDHERALAKRGRKAMPRMAQQLTECGLTVDVILASTARRVQETVQLLQENWAGEAEVMSMAELYLASPQEIMKQIYALHASWSSVLVVGHNPGLAMLASMLAGGEVEMPTAATVVFRAAAADWRIPASSESWKLTALWKPREL